MAEHKGWGDNIYFFDFKGGRVVGYMTPMPEVDDELRCEMKSGKTGRFKIEKVEPQKDPSDMFFADVVFIGYV